MRRDNKTDSFKAKEIARKKYSERQINKFVKWSLEMKGKVKYKDIKKLQTKYNIQCYAESKTRR
jgi:hypothetical protein